MHRLTTLLNRNELVIRAYMYTSDDFNSMTFVKNECYFSMFINQAIERYYYTNVNRPPCFFNKRVHNRHYDDVCRVCIETLRECIRAFNIGPLITSKWLRTREEGLEAMLNENGTDESSRSLVANSSFYKRVSALRPTQEFYFNWNADDTEVLFRMFGHVREYVTPRNINYDQLDAVRRYVTTRLTKRIDELTWPTLTLTNRCIGVLARDDNEVMRRQTAYVNKIVMKIARSHGYNNSVDEMK